MTSWNLTTSGSAIFKAGVHANSSLISYAGNYKTILDNISDEVEGEIITKMRYDVVTNYASLTALGKVIFGHLASCMIAQHIVAYDMSGYIPFGESITILNVLENQIGRELQIVGDDKYGTFLGVVSS